MHTLTYTPESGIAPLLPLAQALGNAKKIVVFTGAGVSAESGISTFRSDSNALWSRYNARTMATPEAFHANPARVWGWYEYRRAVITHAQPNPAHLAIAELAHHFPEVRVITQNVDDLHERAGSVDVIHLHGRLDQARCDKCARAFTHAPGLPPLPDKETDIQPPQCACGGYVRPGVVWFNESLPEDEWDAATRLAGHCDALISVGTSAMVFPAAQLPRLAKSHGATVVQVNPARTELDQHSDFNLRGQAGDILPVLLAALRHSHGDL
jgi:NAD-dependent deacetylase